MAAGFTATTLGRASLRDKQFTVPRHPTLRAGVRLRQVGDTVFIDGAERSHALQGEFARQHLVPLVDLCNGTRTETEIAGTLRLPHDDVHAAITLLWASGAIEDRAIGALGADLDAEVRTFLSRLGGSTGTNANWQEAVERLTGTKVELAGDPLIVERLDTVVREVFAKSDESTSSTGSTRLLLLAETLRSRELVRERAAAAWRSGTPTLRIRASSDSIIVGPYVDPRFTPCLECAASQEPPSVAEAPAESLGLIAGLAGHHLTAVIGRASVTFLPLDSAMISLSDLTTTYQPSASRPGCPQCSYAERGEIRDVPDSARYEGSIELPPRRFIDPKGHLAHYRTTNIALQTQFRSWRSCPRTALPPLDLSLLDRAPADSATSLDRTHLGLILALSFGVRGRLPDNSGVRRWTAAAGNLGSSTCYVIVRDGKVLPRGAYAYLPEEHALALLTTNTPPGAGAVDLIISIDLAKIMRKYGTFAYKLGLLDAGAALSTMRRVVQSTGLRWTLEHDWDDAALSSVLGISSSDEPIASLIGLH